jgi:hypothetical protein
LNGAYERNWGREGIDLVHGRAGFVEPHTIVLEVGVVHSNVIGDVVAIALSDVEHLVDGRKVPCMLLYWIGLFFLTTFRCVPKKMTWNFATINEMLHIHGCS